MSDENVEVVRNALEYFAATDEFLEYDDWNMELDEVHDCGGDRILALLHQSGKPHGSDSAVHLEYGLLHTVRDGLLHRIEAYATREAARRAAGLSA